MRVVVDTNVLVSAILRGRTPRAVIQFIIDVPDYSWMVSREILSEYKEVLSRPKFKLKQEVPKRVFEKSLPLLEQPP
jgi:putative PIN family toxin of toxin-antitoxin system